MLFFVPIILLLSLITLDETATNSLLRLTSDNQQGLYLKLFLLFGLQMVFSPIQAGFSDFFCRKKNLIIAILFSFISILLLKMSYNYGLFFVYFAIIVKSMLGNITPIARASLADTSINKNFRFSIGLSTVSIGLGYFFLILIDSLFHVQGSINIMITLLIFLGLLVFLFFHDLRDLPKIRQRADLLIDLRSIYYNFLRDKNFLLILLIYLLWEIAFYQLFIRDIDLKNLAYEFTAISMCVGYFIGVGLLGLYRKKDQQCIFLGGFIALIFLLLVIVFYILFKSNNGISSVFIGITSLGYGFFIPALFSFISKSKKLHEQGKIYGLIDSTDAIAFSSAFFIDLLTKKLHILLVYFFSFLLIALGLWIFYHLNNSLKKQKRGSIHG